MRNPRLQAARAYRIATVRYPRSNQIMRVRAKLSLGDLLLRIREVKMFLLTTDLRRTEASAC